MSPPVPGRRPGRPILLAVAMVAALGGSAGLLGVVDHQGSRTTARVVGVADTQPAAAPLTLLGTRIPKVLADPDAQAVTLGVVFRSAVSGSIAGVRFYQGPGNSGPHPVTLYTTAGRTLAHATVPAGTAVGWQQATFDRPVPITRGTRYIAAYRAPAGHYSTDEGFFGKPFTAGPLTATGSVFSYPDTFPTASWRRTNYSVDVLFTTAAGAVPTATPTATPVPTPTATPVPTPTPTPVPTPVATPTPTPTPASTSVAPGVCANGLHTPGGSDGMGGCWPYGGNTGVPTGAALSTYDGSCTITTAGTVIDHKIVNCNLNIKAKNVIISNSRVNGAIIVDSDDCAIASYSVSDSTIHVGDINLRGLMSCNFTASRVDVSGGQSMAWCDTCTIQDSYLHSPLEDPAGAAANHAAHNSTVRMSKFAVIKHNTLWCAVKEYAQPNGQDTSGCSANQTGYSHDGSAPYNSTVETNLFMPTSGGYCAYGGSTSGALSSVHDVVFKNNVFKRGTAPSDHGEFVCGYYGAVSSFDLTRPGNQWINNRWDDGTVLPPAS